MVDLDEWSALDTFTGLQAACLWAGVPPVPSLDLFTPSNSVSFDDYQRVLTVLQAFNTAIANGKLRGDTTSNPLALRGTFHGDHVSTLFSRAELCRFAESVGQRPKFLFDTILPSTAPEDAAESPDGPKKKPGRPQEHDWNGFYVEIVRVADMEELPATQADLERRLLRWFQDKFGREPSESAVRERIGDIYRGLKATGWEPRGPKMKR